MDYYKYIKQRWIMKKILITAIALLLLTTLASAQDLKYFPEKSGIIQFKLTGFMEGKQTIYFDDYGMKYMVEQDALYFDAPNNSITYIIRDSSYSIDIIKNDGYKFVDPEKSAYITYYTQTKDPNKAYQELYKSYGGKVIGTEKIKNVECEIWEMSAGTKKIWLANGINYKIELIESGKTGIIELTQFDNNIAFEKDFFDKPDVPFKAFGTTKGK